MRKFLIITGANTAREISNEKPDKHKCETYISDACNYRFPCCQDEWKVAESSLKEYRITGIILSESKTDAEIDIWDDRYIHIFPIGTKVEGNCNGDLTCNILWIN